MEVPGGKSMKPGDYVIFQFEDRAGSDFMDRSPGIPRHGEGIIKSIDSVGMITCEFADTNITVTCLPWAVRPYTFNYKNLLRRVTHLQLLAQSYCMAGGKHPEDAQESIKEYMETKKSFKKFIGFLRE
jgi:hypothetical protein